MTRRAVISGIGPVCAAGVGAAALTDALMRGEAKTAPIEAFDASGFATAVAGEVRGVAAQKIVPKSYRKATKVMARDIQLAVAGADAALRDAGVNTPALDPDAAATHDPARSGCNIGAGLIAAELDELTAALAEAVGDDGAFSLKRWGAEGMQHLTPLWLLKYLPNMLACHVTILHDLRGPSNTITCGEASGGLALAESVRAVRRGVADCAVVGGAESMINPMSYLRMQLTGRLSPTGVARPMDEAGDGTVMGEGGALLVVEAEDALAGRVEPYAVVAGFGTTQSVNRAAGDTSPDARGTALRGAMRAALRAVGLSANDIDAVVPAAHGDPAYDRPECAALTAVFGDRLKDVPLVNVKPLVGVTLAGTAALDLAAACVCLREQRVPATAHRDTPYEGTHPGFAEATPADLRHVLVNATGRSGQTVCVVLSRPGV